MADLSFTQGAEPVVIVNDSSGNQVVVNSDGSINAKITDGTDTVIVDTDGSLFAKPVPIGSQANAWNAANVSSGGNSSVVDCQYARTVTVFGNVSGNVNPIRVQASQDNTNFYTVTTFSAATGNFGVTLDWGARYMRLQVGQNVTSITATIAGK